VGASILSGRGAVAWRLAQPQHAWRSRSTSGAAAARLAQPRHVWRSHSTSGAAALRLAQPQHVWRSRSTSGAAAARLGQPRHVWGSRSTSGGQTAVLLVRLFSTLATRLPNGAIREARLHNPHLVLLWFLNPHGNDSCLEVLGRLSSML